MKLMQQLILILTSFVLIIGCAPNNAIKNSDKWLPADFDHKQSTLLILATTNNSKGIEKLSNEIKKHYPYKFRVIPMNSKFGENSKFSDTTKYKYLLQCALATGNYEFQNNGTQRNTGYTRDWRFVDLINEKVYPYTNAASQGQLTTLVKIFNTIKEKHNYKKK